MFVLQKYTSRFVFFTIFGLFISSCLKHEKSTKNQKRLGGNVMVAVLTDVFLAEGYLMEQTIVQKKNAADSKAYMKSEVYPLIFKQHKVDSTDFYSTFTYYQQHPDKFLPILDSVNVRLNAIHPKDTTKNININTADVFLNPVDTGQKFSKQEEKMQDLFLRNHPEIKEKLKKRKNSKINE